MNETIEKQIPRAPTRRPILLSVTVLAGIGTCFASFMAWQQQSQAAIVRLEAEQPIKDLGEVLPEQTYPITFQVTNTGAYPVEIVEIDSSCTCTATESKPTTIVPGESLEVPAEFSTGTDLGPLGSRLTVVYRGTRRKNASYRLALLRVSAEVVRQPGGPAK